MEFYELAIKPLLKPSMTNCKFAEANMGTVLTWQRSMLALMGEAGQPGADVRFVAASQEIEDAFATSMENCYLAAAAPCMDWQDTKQATDVQTFYRRLLLAGAEERVPALEDLLVCTFVDVLLQDGAFHYEIEKSANDSYHSAVRFRIVDDRVSGFGIYQPFHAVTSPLTPTAIVSMTALIDGVWQPLPQSTRFLCRDKRAERVQELVVTITANSGEPPLPPQVYADNIGCWRWAGSFVRKVDGVNAEAGVQEWFEHTDGQITLERMGTHPYIPSPGQGTIFVQPLGYRYASGEIHHERERHLVDLENGNTICIRSITTTQSDLPAVSRPGSPALTLPNANFGLPREVKDGLGSELMVNIPYVTSGDCGDVQPLEVIFGLIKGELSADGRRMTRDETEQFQGLDGGTTTYHYFVDLEALRE